MNDNDLEAQQESHQVVTSSNSNTCSTIDVMTMPLHTAKTISNSQPIDDNTRTYNEDNHDRDKDYKEENDIDEMDDMEDMDIDHDNTSTSTMMIPLVLSKNPSTASSQNNDPNNNGNGSSNEIRSRKRPPEEISPSHNHQYHQHQSNPTQLKNNNANNNNNINNFKSKIFHQCCSDTDEIRKNILRNTITFMNFMAKLLFWSSLVLLIAGVVWYSKELALHGTDAHLIAWFSAGAFVILGFPISIYGILMHLTNYYQPNIQCYVVRILWMGEFVTLIIPKNVLCMNLNLNMILNPFMLTIFPLHTYIIS